MEPWQTRLLEEAMELAERVAKLRAFVNGPAYSLEEWARRDLAEQLRLMCELHAVLARRIATTIDDNSAARRERLKLRIARAVADQVGTTDESSQVANILGDLAARYELSDLAARYEGKARP